jgi:cyclic beta-1,2-glucan synthetase
LKASRWLLTAAHSLVGKSRLPGAVLDAAAGADEAPLRAELLTADQMAQHGTRLAAAHELTSGRASDRLLPRLASNEKVLVAVWAQLMRNAQQQGRVTPAGEWLLDNFYLIEEDIRAAKRHLPPGYSRELPRLRGGPSAGLPRVYDLALQTVAHGDGRLGRGTLSRFIASYQTVKVLALGELWAIPIMLRLALIENLRRVAVRMAVASSEHELANTWADRILDVADKNPRGLILVIADMARSNPPLTGPFVAELARRLQGRSAALALPLTWIEQGLAESNLTVEQLVQLEAQNQATDQVSVSNSIGSLRTLAATDWREFVEAMSQVDQALRSDPADVYARMDFTTRDSYRHAVEALAKASPLSEAEVATAAVELAAAAQAGGAADTDPTSHVGHYLIGDGQAALEYAAQVRVPRWRRVRRAAVRRLDRRAHASARRRCIGMGVRWAGVARGGGRVRLVAAARGRGAAAGSQPAGRGTDQLGREPARDATPAAADGFFVRHTVGIAHPGRHPDDAGQRPGGRGPGRAVGGALPCQP